MLENDIKKILVSQEEIKQTISELGKQLTEDYQGKDLVVVGVLKGASIFMADLVRAIDLYLDIDFMAVSSYGDATETSGEVKILKDLDAQIKGKDILFVEDIIDTGRTLKYLMELFEYRGAASIKVCTLLDKPERRVFQDLVPDYVGVKVPDEFVVGYGLDFKQKYRNLPYIGVLKEELYQ